LGLDDATPRRDPTVPLGSAVPVEVERRALDVRDRPATLAPAPPTVSSMPPVAMPVTQGPVRARAPQPDCF